MKHVVQFLFPHFVVVIVLFTMLTLPAQGKPHHNIKKPALNNRQESTPRNRNTCSPNRVDPKTLSRLLGQNHKNPPCTANFVTDHDASRIPVDIPHFKCPKNTGDRCVEIQLPWNVSFYSSNYYGLGKNHRKLESKIIYVPSGCHQNVSKEKSRPPKPEAIKSQRKSKKKEPLLKKKKQQKQHSIYS